jgi:hypothetical protein
MAHLCMDSCQDANRVYGGVVSRLAWHWGFLLGFFLRTKKPWKKSISMVGHLWTRTITPSFGELLLIAHLHQWSLCIGWALVSVPNLALCLGYAKLVIHMNCGPCPSGLQFTVPSRLLRMIMPTNYHEFVSYLVGGFRHFLFSLVLANGWWID